MRQMIYLLVKVFGRPKDSTTGSKEISNDLAINVSFGSFGHYLVLSRAFKSVSGVKMC